MYPDQERKYFSAKTLCFLENDMANFLYQEDVMPVLIPNLQKRGIENLLAEMDGFVLQGGSDVCPATYGEQFLDESRWPGDEKRDHYELKIVDYAFKQK